VPDTKAALSNKGADNVNIANDANDDDDYDDDVDNVNNVNDNVNDNDNDDVVYVDDDDVNHSRFKIATKMTKKVCNEVLMHVLIEL
jgi:hypothetical protein